MNERSGSQPPGACCVSHSLRPRLGPSEGPDPGTVHGAHCARTVLTDRSGLKAQTLDTFQRRSSLPQAGESPVRRHRTWSTVN